MWRQKHISGDNGVWCSPQQIQQKMADVRLDREPEDASLCDAAARLKRKNGLGGDDEPGAFRACELWKKEGTCVAPVVYRDVQSRTRPQNLCPVKEVRGVPGSFSSGEARGRGKGQFLYVAPWLRLGSG